MFSFLAWIGSVVIGLYVCWAIFCLLLALLGALFASSPTPPAPRVPAKPKSATADRVWWWMFCAVLAVGLVAIGNLHS